ncbi:MAG: phosphoglycerate kinase [Pseudomonadota bacterium]
MNFQTLDHIDLNGKVVLLRADLNVPVADGAVTDATRIKRLKPTIERLKKERAKIVILSHFGRPKGKASAEFSLEFLTDTLERHWDVPVMFAKDCIGDTAQTAINVLNDGDILLLENVRFHAGEEANDQEFAKNLASLGDIFVNDAFSAAHRAHASTEGLARLLTSAAGLLMEAELKALNDALENPQKPVAALVGGAKISTKLSVLENLIKKVDYLILGGGMANTFLLANNQEIGNSLSEPDMVETTRRIFKAAEDNNCEIVLPIDCVVVDELTPGVQGETVSLENFPKNKSAVDIGEQSATHIGEILKRCKTILWNGPMGVFEIKPFDRGTNAVAEKAAHLTDNGALVSIAGGGDTVAALDNANVIDDFTYISTAGGAFLEWMEGKTLPGVAALMREDTKAA